MAEGGASRRLQAVSGVSGVVICCLLAALLLCCGRDGGEEIVALQDSRLRSLMRSVHSKPDVLPVKGGEKALEAVEGLGRLPDLELLPHKRKSSLDAVADAATKAVVRMPSAKATQAEKLRAKLAVARLMRDAEGKVKQKLETPRFAKAQFHAKMANALFNYKLYKGQLGQRGVHDAKPSAPVKGLQVGAERARALRRKSLLHQQMQGALLNYHFYLRDKGGVDATPGFEVPGKDILLRTTQSLHQVLGAKGRAGTGAFSCSQTGCRVKQSHRTPSGFSDAVPSALPTQELTRKMPSVF